MFKFKAYTLNELLFAGFIVLIVGMILMVSIGRHFFRDTYIVTVTDKERVVSDNGKRLDSYYLVFTERQDKSIRVFSNQDSLIEWKFNSSDIQGQLKVGNTYKIRVYGWRFELFSMYENIVEVEDFVLEKP